MFQIIAVRYRMVTSIMTGLMLACGLFCVIAPNQYQARTRVALRTAPAAILDLPGADATPSGSFASGQTQLETVAGILRSNRLAWKVILDLKLYEAPGFMGHFAARFAGFRPEEPAAGAQSYLVERFQDRLRVGTLPRTLLIEVSFRSRDANLSAQVANALIDAYCRQQAELHAQAADEATAGLRKQLSLLKARADEDDSRLAAFQKRHGILISPQTLANGKPGADEHLPELVGVDELGRELAAANSERILREAEYRAASEGDPEVVLAFDPRVQTGSAVRTDALRQIHARHSELEQELAQLSIERGPNFPRVLEIRQQLKNLDSQLAAENARLREQFHGAWTAAEDHERLVRRSLREHQGAGLRVNQAATTYEGMRREAESTRDLYLLMQDKVEEADLAAGARGVDIWVVDEARPPAKPVSPDPALYLAVTFFVGLWAALGCAFLMESIRPSLPPALPLLAFLFLGASLQAQAPTPSTSGLPTGVARIPVTTDNRNAPNAKDAPAVWNAAGAGSLTPAGVVEGARPVAMTAPIVPGDLLEVSEFHTPEFRSSVRVSADGSVRLPMVEDVRVDGMNEHEAAQAIAAALVTRGMLNHPQVSVFVSVHVGQDVSVLGEVARPGVYPYTVHHRLFDLISAASGVSSMAGGVANIFHRDDPNTPHPIALEASGLAARGELNPELAPGDTVQITRAGLVYVLGDVIRPGGFTVDPTQEFTVLKALSLAWGPSQNASTRKALLIREQKGGRIVTSLNLKRMLKGQDPDQLIRDHDILYVPDSTAKNLINRTIESAIQSAAGVSIYAGMVYSQRF